ncbi:hypothetical protein [Deinococcus yavapaiensis]|uniref:Leucine rich repeat (LRR) protein n=1 Tax=Deinococcus yavapaiensis KR-236 TaxID=694435 RepID=A0A318SJB8_9DEIO|nr:hypothetical protein [Deinococcus yavapaiensis]PYE52033.1 leucine rich repeat (LRR) protein [Deinococcus yavapaiensis KR-236]
MTTDFDVRQATHPATPSRILEQLAQSTRFDVLEAVARHPNTPPLVLAELANEDDFTLSLLAAAHPSTPAWAVAWLMHDHTAPLVVREPHVPIGVLERLARHADDGVRHAALKRLTAVHAA